MRLLGMRFNEIDWWFDDGFMVLANPKGYDDAPSHGVKQTTIVSLSYLYSFKGHLDPPWKPTKTISLGTPNRVHSKAINLNKSYLQSNNPPKLRDLAQRTHEQSCHWNELTFDLP